ncbi:MAG: PLP-dependent aminotransferase family protein [Isosphaeraceae bacterium]
MPSNLALSSIARRTSAPAITDLMQRALATPGLISMAAGFVDQASLPASAVLSTLTPMLADPAEGHRSLQYGTTIGDRALREALIRRLEQEEKVGPGTYGEFLPRTVVTTGSQQLLALVCEALLDPGDIVLVESPTYFVFLGVLESRGARAIGVATDSGGLCLNSLELTLKEIDRRGELDRVKLLYTVSEHSNPTGLSLAADRRKPLLELVRRWSREGRILILDDAAYRGLDLEGAEYPGLWSLDPGGETVILARTFSKTFSPGLKTGFGILPTDLLGPVLSLKGNQDFGSNHFTQQLLERALTSGLYEAHRLGLAATYRAKRDALLAALDIHLGGIDGVSWTKPMGGIYVWLTLPEGVDAGPQGELFPRCIERGVLYVPGALAFAAEPAEAPANTARLCYGVPDEAELVEGVRRLSAALTGCLDPVA